MSYKQNCGLYSNVLNSLGCVAMNTLLCNLTMPKRLVCSLTIAYQSACYHSTCFSPHILSMFVDFVEIHCEANMVANFMAKFDHPHDGPLLSSDEPPMGLRDILHIDAFGPPFIRMSDS
ncbi:hypothetical protein V6N13_037725 [Hibiscus sabdariffa]|uniref:Uncharacterized protein n=1 Tax=Hibiscus sabdariffa TaxID=183260 RepID=A0ABR2S4G6_9ROSI